MQALECHLVPSMKRKPHLTCRDSRKCMNYVSQQELADEDARLTEILKFEYDSVQSAACCRPLSYSFWIFKRNIQEEQASYVSGRSSHQQIASSEQARFKEKVRPLWGWLEILPIFSAGFRQGARAYLQCKTWLVCRSVRASSTSIHHLNLMEFFSSLLNHTARTQTYQLHREGAWRYHKQWIEAFLSWPPEQKHNESMWAL